MKRAAILAAFFLMAGCTDALSVYWQEAREADAAESVAAYSMALEMLTWLPVLFAIRDEDYGIVAAAVLGSTAGAWVAML